MKDLFSSHANEYARYRPQYPQNLFAYLYAQINCFDLAWDCGTGNGQAAIELAKKFKKESRLITGGTFFASTSTSTIETILVHNH